MTYRRILSATAVLLSVHLSLPAAVPVQAPSRPVIIDTDAGTDDLMAIAYLLARRDFRLEAVTISYGLAHQGPGAKNILGLLELAARFDVPVYLGRETPRGAHNPFPAAWRTQSDNMTGVSLPVSPRSPERQPAVEFLSARLRDGSRPVDVLALGALTNLADVLEQQPTLTAVRSLVIMGGAVGVPGNLSGASQGGNTTSEWNLFADPEAARRVLAAGLPVLLIPLDATNAVRINPALVQELRERADTPLGRVVSGLLSTATDRITGGLYYAWDPLAAMALLDRPVVRSERVSVSVRVNRPEAGRTVRDPRGATIEVAIGADAKRFREAFVTTLSGR